VVPSALSFHDIEVAAAGSPVRSRSEKPLRERSSVADQMPSFEIAVPFVTEINLGFVFPSRIDRCAIDRYADPQRDGGSTSGIVCGVHHRIAGQWPRLGWHSGGSRQPAATAGWFGFRNPVTSRFRLGCWHGDLPMSG